MNTLHQLLQQRIVISDGGMGSLLQAAGLTAGELPETWNILRPEVIKGVHLDYLDAGADIIATNTFGANRFKYPEGGGFSLSEVTEAAVGLAREAVKEKGHGLVALDVGPTGKLLKPMGELDLEDCISAYREVASTGAKSGADLIFIETMSDLYELKAAVLGVKEGCDLPVMASVAFDAKGKLLTGGTPASVVALLEGLKVDVLGMNCGLSPEIMAVYAKELLKYASIPVIVQPNAGLPRTEGDRTVYDVDAKDYAEGMRAVLEAGASIVGGCCGTTPAHIRALKELASTFPVPKREKKDITIASSFADALIIGEDPVVIGERINPTGKKRFQQALRENDTEYILNVALSEQAQGAHALDVNVGLPGIDEAAVLTGLVSELQSVTELPLMLDTSDALAMEKALRVYNGKALINSVNGKQEVMDAVLPLAAKYGGVIVALCLDENGIPETAEERADIAGRIIETAASYGIDKKDILVDALCMTVSANEDSALTTLKTIRLVRERYGVKTVLGVSNISFGLPARELINSAFFTLALENGLSAGIINPGSDMMMRSLDTFRALHALDPHCGTYIAKYADFTAETASSSPAKVTVDPAGKDTQAEENTDPLSHAIRKGLKDAAVNAAKEAIKTSDPLEIINERMMPALDTVGKGFEAGTLFLPQLLMSAEAAKAAFEVVRGAMDEKGGSSEKKGPLIIATVKGDIHDIGKNIVKVLLENYGYDVIDLGRDVAPETILETVLEHNVKLVGLSALMTTTVPAMEDTIKLLREKAPGTKVMVGGAVLNARYADEIGADSYSKDALGAVEYAASIFG